MICSSFENGKRKGRRFNVEGLMLYLTQRAQRAQKNVDSLTFNDERDMSLNAGAGEVAVDTRRRAQRRM